jgi:hypothetical protein
MVALAGTFTFKAFTSAGIFFSRRMRANLAAKKAAAEKSVSVE